MTKRDPARWTIYALMACIRPACICVMLMLGIPFPSFSEEYVEEFLVRPGETRLLSPSTDTLIVGTLILREDSTIRIPSESVSFLIIAKETIAYRGSSIDARGTAGPSSTAIGGIGEDGTNGVHLHLFLGSLASSGLQIMTNGGRGGSGGPGRNGTAGDEASCLGSEASDGGPGGDGGNGGAAGNGGSIFVAIYPDSTQLNLSLISDGGRAGDGGPGGPGGPGGRGKNNCGIWPYWKRGAGANGSKGDDGDSGKLGESGESKLCIVQDPTLQETLERIHDQLYGREDLGELHGVASC